MGKEPDEVVAPSACGAEITGQDQTDSCRGLGDSEVGHDAFDLRNATADGARNRGAP